MIAAEITIRFRVTTVLLIRFSWLNQPEKLKARIRTIRLSRDYHLIKQLSPIYVDKKNNSGKMGQKSTAPQL